ncbi:DUF4097 family beta strand repeat-containing protein [Vallitalea sp.]|uniref:DUF4097 family beta strand repeat-containing protein n=1 Tax=Vallitalea sp. TaxID=1882829 RepID=UPI0025D578B7|nr:DUF4097 family beta strand repeat-containing protein [Vallitalea sp.]MCT4685762.1 DUF4097 domain-containing protein [Vallitalea sp.]
MKHKKLGTFTLAITLIVWGIILLISNFMYIDINKILRILSAVSIILIGVEFLFFDWYYKRKQLTMELKVSVTSIVLLVIIYSSSFLISGIYMYSNDSVNGFRRIFNITDEYEVTKNYTEKAIGLTNIQVDNRRGNIEIQGTETEDILITAVFNISTFEEKETAMELAEDMVSIDRRQDKTLTIKTKNNILNHRGTYTHVNYIIEIPKNMEVDISSRNGNIYVGKVDKKTTIKTSNSVIQVDNIGDELTIENDFGSIEVEAVAGSTKIKNKNGDVNVENIEGDLDIKNSYSDTNFDNISGNVTIDQEYGDIDGNKVGKNLEINGEGASVKIDDVQGLVTIETSNESITAKNINSDIELSNNYGDILLEKINSNIKIKSENGDIDIDNYNINVTKIDIVNSYGNVNIDIPNDQQAVFELRTNYGNIESVFDFDIEEDNNEKSVKATIGDSHSIITINANNGDILIN